LVTGDDGNVVFLRQQYLQIYWFTAAVPISPQCLLRNSE